MAFNPHKNTHGTLAAVNKHLKNVWEQLKALKMAKMQKVEKVPKTAKNSVFFALFSKMRQTAIYSQTNTPGIFLAFIYHRWNSLKAMRSFKMQKWPKTLKKFFFFKGPKWLSTATKTLMAL